PHGVSLSWDTRDGSGKAARYPWMELDRLQRFEQTSRAGYSTRRSDARGEGRAWSELLRTLGQDLDSEDADSTSITGNLDRLTASWMTRDGFATRQYTVAELWGISQRRAVARSAAA